MPIYANDFERVYYEDFDENGNIIDENGNVIDEQ